jgi:DNA-binding NarL/FixJ family response regulator
MTAAKASSKRARILLADDHQILLDGLRQLLDKAFEVVGCALDGFELVALAQCHRPDVIVVDITMPRLNGIEAIKRVREAGLSPKVVFLTVLDEPRVVLEAYQAGVDCVAFLLKHSASTELITAIQEVIAGRSYLSARITSGVLDECLHRADHSAERLTNRQIQVLCLIAQGKTMKEVASVLAISTRTAEAHKYQMMHQLGIRTSAELIQFAMSEGLVTLPITFSRQANSPPVCRSAALKTDGQFRF